MTDTTHVELTTLRSSRTATTQGDCSKIRIIRRAEGVDNAVNWFEVIKAGKYISRPTVIILGTTRQNSPGVDRKEGYCQSSRYEMHTNRCGREVKFLQSACERG